jgi:hypothetical protein
MMVYDWRCYLANLDTIELLKLLRNLWATSLDLSCCMILYVFFICYISPPYGQWASPNKIYVCIISKWYISCQPHIPRSINNG